MTTEQNIRTIQNIYAAFARGDLAFVLSTFSDNVEEFGVISATKTAVPWHLPPMKGKAAAVRYFDVLNSVVEHRMFEPSAVAGSGPHVYATLRMEMLIRATGKILELREVIHHFTFDDAGKIVRWRGSEDTASTSAAFAA